MSHESSDHVDTPDAGADLTADEVREIEEERARRLDPANRPDGAEVDNTGAQLPTVEEFARRQDEDAEGKAGTSDPSKAFRDLEVSDEERAEIEAERERRLDPANRPDGAEVDNTGKPAPEAPEAPTD